MNSQIYAKIYAIVKDKFASDTTGHDWYHIERVVNMACLIHKKINSNFEEVRFAALLHDIADHKFHGGDFEIGGKVATDLLLLNGASNDFAKKIGTIVNEISFKGARVADKPTSIEAQIVQDADRLDAIGAIGIARAFSFGGAHDRPFYLPDSPPNLHGSKEEYAKSKSHSINHFYEKLLLLKDRLHTSEARQIAESRHKLMEDFLKQFHSEWNYTHEN